MPILLVEDEELIAAFVRKALEREGLTVEWAGDGESAVALAASRPFELIVLDVLLPGKNGFQVCQQIREHDLVTPILMLTARGEMEDKVFGLDCGADDYVTKPFAVEELLARVRSLLRRSRLIRRPPLAALDLVFDMERYEVTRGGVSVTLTATEFRLLDYLVQHAGRVCARHELLRAVWGYDFDPGTNIVDVCIGRLRRKLDPPGAEPLLHTVRGAGYRLGA